MLKVKEEDIDKITEAFYLILRGKKPTPIELPGDYPDNEIKQAVGYINKFITEYNSATDSIHALSNRLPKVISTMKSILWGILQLHSTA